METDLTFYRIITCLPLIITGNIRRQLDKQNIFCASTSLTIVSNSHLVKFLILPSGLMACFCYSIVQRGESHAVSTYLHMYLRVWWGRDWYSKTVCVSKSMLIGMYIANVLWFRHLNCFCAYILFRIWAYAWFYYAFFSSFNFGCFFSTSASSRLDHLQSWALLWRIPRPTCHSGYYRLNAQYKFKVFNHHDYFFGFLENFRAQKNKFSFTEEKNPTVLTLVCHNIYHLILRINQLYSILIWLLKPLIIKCFKW